MPDANALLTLNWSAPTWDLVILIFFVVAGVFYAFALGRDRLIVILVATYLSLSVVSAAPFLEDLARQINTSAPIHVLQIGLFAGIFLVLFFLLSRSALLHNMGAGAHGTWWQVTIFGLLQAGLLISVILSFFPPEALVGLSDGTRHIFVSEYGVFFWIALPILALIFLERE